jgi:hypothetical protein
MYNSEQWDALLEEHAKHLRLDFGRQILDEQDVAGRIRRCRSWRFRSLWSWPFLVRLHLHSD